MGHDSAFNYRDEHGRPVPNSSSASQSTICNVLIVMGENLATQFYLSKHFWLIYPFLQSTHLGSLGQCNIMCIRRPNPSYGRKERNWIIQSCSSEHNAICHHTYGDKSPGPGLHQESVVPDVHLHHHHYVVRSGHGCTA